MNPQSFILWKDQLRENRIASITRFLGLLPMTCAWEITVKRFQKKRSLSQNAYLWGAVYPTIIKAGGEQLAGWTADDLHDYYLGVHFGVEVLRLNDRDYERPLRRSSKLSTVEFMAFVATIQREAAQLGIFVEDPDPNYWLKREAA